MTVRTAILAMFIFTIYNNKAKSGSKETLHSISLFFDKCTTMSKWSIPLPKGKRQSQGSPNCWKGMHSGHFDLNRDTCLSFPCQASSLWGPLEYWSLKVDRSKPTGQLSILFQLEDLFSKDGGAIANRTVADQIDLFIRLQTFPQILPHFRFQCVH